MPLGSRRARLGVTAGAVFVLALAVRLLMIAWVPGWDTDYGLSGDENDFHAIATNLEAGRGYVWEWAGGGPDRGSLQPTAFRAPLWPGMLSLLYVVTGPSVFAGRLLVAVLDAGVCALLVPLGALLLRPAVGVVAGALAALYPPLWVNTFRIHSETSFTVALVVALLVAEALRRRPSPARAGLLGVLLGLAALGRPNGLLVTVALLAWVAWVARGGGRRRVLAVTAACALGTAAVMVPWVVRVEREVGALVPVTTQGGSVLAGYYSSAMLDRSKPTWGGWDFPLVIRAFSRAHDEASFNRDLQRVGRRWIADHPGGTAKLMGYHVLRYFDLYWEMGGRRQIEYFPTRYTGANVAAVVSWWAVAALAGVGLWRARRMLTPLVPALLVFAALAASGIVFGASPRLRAPSEPVAVLFASIVVTGFVPARFDRLYA